ncbi:hypothetical protein WKI71_25920 [Streptomyces sp. MS1.AVA.1]|uniref:Uncharacterized protein n=1 Tax=Streptomyces machairae TaxID=3134109 RepID=A0ABU8UR05_9ACTN
MPSAAVPEPRDAPPQDATPASASDSRPGKLSLSVAAASAPGKAAVDGG